MPRRNIAKWNRIGVMWLAHFPRRSNKEIDIMSIEMARQQAEYVEDSFKHEDGVARRRWWS
jgi:hypothetical protein